MASKQKVSGKVTKKGKMHTSSHYGYAKKAKTHVPNGRKKHSK